MGRRVSLPTTATSWAKRTRSEMSLWRLDSTHRVFFAVLVQVGLSPNGLLRAPRQWIWRRLTSRGFNPFRRTGANPGIERTRAEGYSQKPPTLSGKEKP